MAQRCMGVLISSESRRRWKLWGVRETSRRVAICRVVLSLKVPTGETLHKVPNVGMRAMLFSNSR